MKAGAFVACIVLFGAFGRLAIGAEDPTSVTVAIGQRSVHLPAPAGSVEITTNREVLRRVFEAGLPKENRHLASFAASEEIARIESGLPMTSWAIAQSIRQIEEVDVDERAFQELRATVRDNWKELIERVEERLNSEFAGSSERIGKELNVDVALSAGNVAPLEIFQDDIDIVGIAMLMNGEVKVGEKSVKATIVMTMTMLNVEERVLCLYIYRDYKAAADLDAVKSAASAWTGAVRSANGDRGAASEPGS